MKRGMSFGDRVQVRELIKQGLDAGRIGQILKMEPVMIQRLIDLDSAPPELTQGQKAAATRKRNQEAKSEEEGD